MIMALSGTYFIVLQRRAWDRHKSVDREGLRMFWHAVHDVRSPAHTTDNMDPLLRDFVNKPYTVCIGFAEAQNPARANADPCVTYIGNRVETVVVRARRDDLVKVS